MVIFYFARLIKFDFASSDLAVSKQWMDSKILPGINQKTKWKTRLAKVVFPWLSEVSDLLINYHLLCLLHWALEIYILPGIIHMDYQLTLSYYIYLGSNPSFTHVLLNMTDKENLINFFYLAFPAFLHFFFFIWWK